jgi:uncharacterized membrane protein HdeD (DUF308 family)
VSGIWAEQTLHEERTVLNALSQNWWATVLRGLLAIGVGILAWSRPDIF